MVQILLDVILQVATCLTPFFDVLTTPIVAGPDVVQAGPIGGIISGVAGLIGRKKRARKQQNALRLGFDFARESPLGTDFLPTGGAANNALAGVFGVGGDPNAQRQAIETLFNTPGFQFIRDQALEGVTSSAAANNKLNSGATLKALQDRSAGVAGQFLPFFTNALRDLANRGLAAGSTIASAGSAIGPQNAQIVRDRQNQLGQSVGAITGGVGEIAQNAGFNPFGMFG